MKGIVNIREIATEVNDYGLFEVNVKFDIYYDDGQDISTEISFSKYDYTYKDIMTCIQKYFKGDLKYFY